MIDYKTLPFAEWLEETCEDLIDFKPDTIGLIALNDKEDQRLTSYYMCSVEDKSRLIHWLLSDIVMETVLANTNLLRHAIAHDEEEGDDDE